MQYNFDTVVDRRGTSCLKYDQAEKIFGGKDLLPMWVADMDFSTPDFVLKAIHNRLEHPVLGYSFQPESQFESIVSWVVSQHQWKIQKEWIAFAAGVVPALNLAILEFTEPGDTVLIQPPVYFPFFSTVKSHGRKLALNPLKLRKGRYEMDLEQLEEQAGDKAKMLILCNPHNPTGNVWRKDELTALAELCLRKNIMILSDEIHCDIVYPGNKHIPLASLSDEIAGSTITLMSASKTFNIAGLSTSYFIASDPALYKRLHQATANMHLDSGNIFGNVALESAYTFGAEWLEQLLKYLAGNIQFCKEFINSHMPSLRLIEPEATFMLWIDFRQTGMSDKEVCDLLISRAGVGLSNGILFGKNGSGFQRINIGCPRSTLEKGMEKISKIFH